MKRVNEVAVWLSGRSLCGREGPRNPTQEEAPSFNHRAKGTSKKKAEGEGASKSCITLLVTSEKPGGWCCALGVRCVVDRISNRPNTDSCKQIRLRTGPDDSRLLGLKREVIPGCH